MSDPGTSYRTRDEVMMMRSTSDPVEGLKAKLITSWQIFSEHELKAIDKECRQQVDNEVLEAEESATPENSPNVLFQDIYVPGSEPAWMRGRTVEETHYF